MNIADVAALVNQVQGGPVAILVGSPGCAVIILCHCTRDIQIDESLFQVVQILLVGKLGVVIADDNKTFIFVCVVPFSQRGNYVLAVNSTKGPHINRHDFAAQVGQPQRRIHIQPDFIGQLGSKPEVR